MKRLVFSLFMFIISMNLFAQIIATSEKELTEVEGITIEEDGSERIQKNKIISSRSYIGIDWIAKTYGIKIQTLR